jgi:hypothetical protein
MKSTLSSHQDVYCCHKFPNDMVVTFNFKKQQIPELEGRFTPKLLKQIQERSSDITDFFGFDEEDFEDVPIRVLVCEVDKDEKMKFVAENEEIIGDFIAEVLTKMHESSMIHFTVYTAKLTPKRSPGNK